MNSAKYLICGTRSSVPYGDRTYDGVRCGCRAAHFFYALPLTERHLATYQEWQMAPTGGRRLLGDLFVSNSCAVPGTSIKLRLEHGPSLLPKAIADWLLAGGRGPVPPRRVELPAECKSTITSELLRLARAVREHRSMASSYKALMHTLLWVWTADAYDTHDEEVVRDAFKYRFERLRHTEEAHRQFLQHGLNGLVHEHAVPRNVLIEHLCGRELSHADAQDLLETYCFGVIVTDSQDRNELGGELKSSMPLDWSFDNLDEPLARYGRLNVQMAGACPVCT